MLWVVLNNLEFQLEPRESVDAARTHHPWFPDVITLEGNDWPRETRQTLEAMGYRLRVGGIQGDVHTIVVDPKTGQNTGLPTAVGKPHALGRLGKPRRLSLFSAFRKPTPDPIVTGAVRLRSASVALVPKHAKQWGFF